MTYAEKLKDPRWQKKRLEILERDGWKCVVCGETTKTLHVHHVFYEKGKEPWECEDKWLVSLCCECHQLEPEIKSENDSDFLKVLRYYGWLECEINEVVHLLVHRTNKASPRRITSLLRNILGSNKSYAKATKIKFSLE